MDGNRVSQATRVVVLAVCAILAVTPRGVAGEEIVVLVVRPSVGESLFGVVEVEVRVESEEEIGAVELWLDGERRLVVDRRPFRFVIDVGEENRERRIEVVARGVRGGVGRAVVVAPAVEIDEAIDLQLHTLYATATDALGRRVLDLPRGAFEVRDEGRRQEIVTFERGDIPFVATLLVDASGSMRGEALEVALDGARAFAEGMAENDRVRIVLHDDRPHLVTGFESDPRVLTAALEGAEAGDGTAVLDNLYRALVELESQQGRRVIVLLSDGWDLHSVVSVEQLQELARLSQTLVYWVRLGAETAIAETRGLPVVQRRVAFSAWRDAEGFQELERQLRRLVRRSGGRVDEVASVGDVEPVFRDILRELREQYAVGYYPTPRRNDGSWREVQLTVERSGIRLRTREGYVDR